MVDLQPAGERADAGEALPLGELAPQDLQLELGHELVPDRDSAPPVQDDVHGKSERTIAEGTRAVQPQRAASSSAVEKRGSMSTGNALSRSSTRLTLGRTTDIRASRSLAFA